MKKLISVLIFLGMFTVAFSQTVCPTAVPTLTFTYTKPLVNGQVLGAFSVCDPDAGQTETWSISSGNTAGYFTIVKSDTCTDGLIKVANASAINAGTVTTYTLTVKVTDNGVPPLFSTAIIILIEGNTAPVINNQTFTINENPANGTPVGSVVASDPDKNQSLTYSIVSGNTLGAFSINASTGVVTVVNGALLNYESISAFLLGIKVTDNASSPLNAQATITIKINDINEAPVIFAQKS